MVPKFILFKLTIIYSVNLINTHNAHNQYHHDSNQQQQHFPKMDAEHIIEDIKEQMNFDLNADQVKEDDLSTYYFRIHDFDGNQKLDGLEILTGLNHVVDNPKFNSKSSTETPIHSSDPNDAMNRILKQKEWANKYDKDAEFIDNILKEYDGDGDGYLSYPEYMHAKKSEELKASRAST